MDLQAMCTSGDGAVASQWLLIPKKDFLVAHLEPGIYYLRNRLVPDQGAALSVGRDEGCRRMSWNSITGISSNSEDSKDEFRFPIEEMQYSMLETVIMGKLKVLHGTNEMDCGGKFLELQNLNDLLLMGFDYYTYEPPSCDAVVGEEHLGNFFKTNPCLYPVIHWNPSSTASPIDTPEIVDITRLKECFVRLRRLEDELPAELVEKLWESYNSYKESIERQTDNDDDEDEDYDVDVSPVPKRRRGRPRKQVSKVPAKKKSVKPKSWMSRGRRNATVSLESSDSDSTDDDDYDYEDIDEDYVPLRKRRTSKYGLRRRN